MNKKVLLAAGILVAAGTVAAVSAPSVRGPRHGSLLDDLVDGFGRTSHRISQSLGMPDMDRASSREERKGRRSRAQSRHDADREDDVAAAEVDDGARGQHRGNGRTRRSERDSKPAKDELGRGGKERSSRQDDDDDASEGDAPRASGRAPRRSAERDQASGDGREARRHGASVPEGRGDRHFQRMDKNGDGVIEAAEFAVAEAERIASKSRRFFKRHDADGDGKVTREEYNRAAMARSAALDPDDDDRTADGGARTRRSKGPAQ